MEEKREMGSLTAAINRVDTLQRKGLHPPSKAGSSYPGLECSGIIEAVGKVVVQWKVGDQVCNFLSGGGYAEKVATGQVLPVPSGVSLKDTAGILEVAHTVWSTVLMMSRLSAGETFLIHRVPRFHCIPGHTVFFIAHSRGEPSSTHLTSKRNT
ncbi:unnamed protein product, partial [Vitis vinifera]